MTDLNDDNDAPGTAFGNGLWSYRRAHGITLWEAAERIGVTFLEIANVESGRRILDEDEQKRWTDALAGGA